MKKEVFVLSLIGLLVLTGCKPKESINTRENNNMYHQEINRNQKMVSNIIQYNSIEDYVGMWSSDGTGYESNVTIFISDNGLVKFDFYAYRLMSFEASDIRIEDGVGRFVSYGVDYQGQLIMKNGKVTISFEGEHTYLNDIYEFDYHTLSQTGNVDEELNEMIQNHFQNIPESTYQYKQNNDFIILNRLSSIVVKEGKEQFRQYLNGPYIIRKSDNKRIKDVTELFTQEKLDKVDEYILKKIELKKEEWDLDHKEDDSYLRDFPWRINFETVNEYTEFILDIENEVLKIKVASYPDEASRALGDLYIDVPLTLVY